MTLYYFVTMTQAEKAHIVLPQLRD